MDIFDILEDLSDELSVVDFYHFLSINELSYELTYKIVRRVDYYYEIFEQTTLHEASCYLDRDCACIRIGSVVEHVCFVGDLDVIRWLHYVRGHNFGSDADIIYAVAGGHLEVAKWLHEIANDKINDISDLCMDYACANNYIDIAEWLRYNHWEGDITTSFGWASQHDHLDMLKWLVLNYGDNDNNIKVALNMAHNHKRAEVIEWIIHEPKYKCLVDGYKPI